MKKLELNQMINVNGGEWSGRRCARVFRRARRRSGSDKGDTLMSKYMLNCFNWPE